MSSAENHDIRGKELHRLELQISHFLRTGVLFAGLVLFVGWIWMWLHGQDISREFTEYNPHALKDTWQEAIVSSDYATIISVIGLVVLVALPVIRVFLSGVLFLKQKDHRLALMAFAVFSALVLSLLLGIDI